MAVSIVICLACPGTPDSVLDSVLDPSLWSGQWGAWREAFMGIAMFGSERRHERTRQLLWLSEGPARSRLLKAELRWESQTHREGSFKSRIRKHFPIIWALQIIQSDPKEDCAVSGDKEPRGAFTQSRVTVLEDVMEEIRCWAEGRMMRETWPTQFLITWRFLECVVYPERNLMDAWCGGGVTEG